MLATFLALFVGWLIAGVILSLAGVWFLVLTLETGAVMEVQILILIAGPVLTIGGIIQAITSRPVVRLKRKQDEQKM